ncbi:Two-component response regulator, malate [Lachnospiraceae bacterium TWA4]|nr:Two-component response regulator, malate [Lachnospiraceae bacterium TWA4]
MIHVVITEDDPMVMAINKKMLEKHPKVEVVKTFFNGKDTLDYLKEHTIDLLFLDVYMPKMNGLEVLTEIRHLNLPVDVIMITAANDAKSVSQAIRLGIIDYLVKPFDSERLQAALSKYIQTHRVLEKKEDTSFCQEDIDNLLQAKKKSSKLSVESLELEKGLQPKTLELVLDFLHNEQKPVTSSNIGAAIGLSRITVRKYLNFLESQNFIASQVDYDTGGRPRILYYWKED